MARTITAEHGKSTIYDVAERAGVSIATVSRFLNSPEKVTKETAQAIQAAVNELAYFRHGNAGTQASRQIGRIAVLTPFFPAPSFVQRLQGMMPVFRANNFEMVVYTVDSPAHLEEYLHSLPLTRRLDGLVIMSVNISEMDARRLLDSGIQVVTIEYASPHFSRIVCDNVRGGRMAGELFARRGYGPCAFIGDDFIDLAYSLHPTEERLEGFRGALEAVGQELPAEYVRTTSASVEGGRRAAMSLLDLPRPPRAIFAVSDLMATGVLKAARARGLRVPEDLAVLGFDDIDMADYLDLSTISQRLGDSGRLAAELLIARVRDAGKPPQTVNLDLEVIERATT